MDVVYWVVVINILLGLKVMDPVGRIPMGRGALALHATFLENELTSKPTFLSWEEASALNGRVQTGTCMARFLHCVPKLNGEFGSILSAYHAIVEAGKLRAGQRLFINGTHELHYLSGGYGLSYDLHL